MKRIAAMLLLLCALPLFAQTDSGTPPVPDTTAADADAQAKADAKDSTEEPITFSFGPQEDGGFGAVVKGSAYYPLRRAITGGAQPGQVVLPRTSRFGGFFTPTAYLYLSPEVNWSSEEGAQNQYALSARPSFQLGYQKDVSAPNYPRDPTTNLPVPPASLPWQPWPMTAPFFEAYADVRRHSAQAETPDTPPAGGDATTTPQNVDATFYGAGIGIAVPWISRAIEASRQDDPEPEPANFPMLRITYYKSGGDSGADVPADIKADQFDASLNFSLPLAPYGGVKPRLDFEGDLSRPLTGDDRKWKSLVKAALLLQLGESDFKPVISYTSGEKFGFKYDRQMLLGIAFDLAGNFLGGN